MAQTSIRLAEWESLTPGPGTKPDNVFLEDDAEVQGFGKQLTKSEMSQVSELRNGLLLRASSYVGRIRLGGLQITVTPKVEGKSFPVEQAIYKQAGAGRYHSHLSQRLYLPRLVGEKALRRPDYRSV